MLETASAKGKMKGKLNLETARVCLKQTEEILKVSSKKLDILMKMVKELKKLMDNKDF